MKTILIAEDDPVMVKLLEFNLRRAGYRTVACREGTAVGPCVRAELPDLVILDMMLPGRTGLELLHDLRAEPALATLPVVVVTSQGKFSIQAELRQAGADNVFTKPFSPTVLLARVRELLGEPAVEKTNP